MIKTNCELPKCLLKENDELNQMDFVLFHLLKDRQYSEWAFGQRANKRLRTMILDNGAYEMWVTGGVFDEAAFADCVDALQPDYYILPDVLRDKDLTLNKTCAFMDKYGKIIQSREFNPTPLPVIQGNTIEELNECMQAYIDYGFECVCVPFHLTCFRDMEKSSDIRRGFLDVYGRTNPDLEFAMGRVQWVSDNRDKLREAFRYVHFLGSHCPLEKIYYKDFESMDTGYPVKLGMTGQRLFKENGKPDIIIDDFFNKDLDGDTKNIIRGNIKLFREL